MIFCDFQNEKKKFDSVKLCAVTYHRFIGIKSNRLRNQCVKFRFKQKKKNYEFGTDNSEKRIKEFLKKENKVTLFRNYLCERIHIKRFVLQLDSVELCVCNFLKISFFFLFSFRFILRCRFSIIR